MAVDTKQIEATAVPIAVTERYKPTKAYIRPDKELGWIRRMVPVVTAHKWPMAIGFAAALLMMVSRVVAPAIVARGIDEGIVEQTSPLSSFIVLLFVLGAATGVFGYLFRYYLQKVGYEIEFDLRTLVYDHLSKLSFSYFDHQQTGQLISRANSDIRSVQMFLGFAPMMSTTVVMFFLALAIMLRTHVGLTLVSILSLPGVYFVGTNMRKKMFPISWMVQARMADVATIVEENVTGVRVVKSFAAERQQIGLLDKAAQRLLFANYKQVDVQAVFSPLMQNLPRIGMVVVLVYGGWLVMQEQIGLGVLVQFNAYLLMMQAPFMMIGFLMMMAQRSAASAQRIFEILDTPQDVADRPGATDLVSPRGEIEFRNVTFGYGSGPELLQNFSLRIEPGQTVALVGRTGCGKSTVARLLPRFYDVRDGLLTIDGRDIRDYTVTSLRNHVGLVMDEPFLFSESLRENIRYGRPDASEDEVVAASTAAGAHDFIMEFPEGYDTVVGERGYTLSGGQRQRIAIARTLLVNPKILILDDATSSVDVRIEQRIHDALESLMQGRTTLIVAHRLSTISLADRVLLMDQGRIVADGTHAELMRTTPLYAEVLAHAEEEYEAAHAPKPDPTDSLPPRMRAMMRMMKEREEKQSARPPMGDMGPMGPGMPGVS